MSWSTKTLGELIEESGGEIRTGPFGSQLHKSDYVDDPCAIPVVMPKNMVGGKVDTSSIARIDETTVNRLNSHLLSEGDILLGRRGDIGRRAWVGEYEAGWLCGTGSMRISAGNSREFIPRYLYYYLELPQAIEWLQAHSVGATMPNLSAGIVRQLPVTYPPISTQVEIIGELDSIEALIANTRRRIEILEEMARLLYREWFVHFRFPGHENVELVDSELGLIPKGWVVARVSEVIETIGGGTPSREVDEYWSNGSVQWYTPSDLTREKSIFAIESSDRITELGLRKSSAKRFPAGSVMLTSRATIGEVSIATSEASTNQGFITCLPSERLTTNYLYFWLNENVPLLKNLAGGATFKELRKSTFRELPILVPDQSEMVRFEERIGPPMTLVKNLLQQNAVLRETRDLLLPRLVSGELDVSDLDVELEAVGV
jgi:type I restriction enzyme S subunit